MEEGCESSVKCNSEVEKEVMDTPERSNNNHIATTVGEFEDSPVFTFLNSLSPIKPVKSTHMTQAINPLSFVSPSSIFSSPHVDSSGESIVLRRHQFPDPSQPEFSSYDGNMVYKSDKEATSCLWDSLIVDASDMFDTGSYIVNTRNDVQNMHLIGAVCSGQQVGGGSGLESLSTQPGEGSDMIENVETHGMTASSVRENPCEIMDYEEPLETIWARIQHPILLFFRNMIAILLPTPRN